MEQYIVTGMTCAACQNRVEKAVSKVPGVTSCSVSLLTNSMGVEGNAKESDIVAAVEKVGYSAIAKNSSNQKQSSEEDALVDRETPKLKKRLLWSIIFLVVLMYITMGHNMWDWPVPSFLAHNHLGLAIIQMLLAIIVMFINRTFFINGFRTLFDRNPNMDTLIALGSSVSFAWSFYILMKMTYLITQGTSNMDLMELYHDELYFESAAMIPALITVGKMLEAKAKGKTTDALKSLMKLAPKTAVIIKDNEEQLVRIEEVQVGDIFLVKPGESIPVDGVVLEGESAINESALTGESIPVDKKVGDNVSAATINTSSYLKCKATRIGKDTTLSQIIQMVSDAAATKAPIAKIADRVSGVFVPTVITIALLTTIGWLLIGKQTLAFALARGISVLVISCPCALGLATPVAIMVGNGIGAKHGILFKTSEALEETGKVQMIALDKTGTITVGLPTVTDIVTNHIPEVELIQKAYSLEKNSEHPLAKAIIEKAEEMQLTASNVEEFKILAGNGLVAKIDNEYIYGGNHTYISSHIVIPSEIEEKASTLASNGKTPLYFSNDHELLGMIAVADVIKEDSIIAIQELHEMGIETIMLTGDNIATAQAIGKQVGVKHVVAGVLPDGKESIVKKLQQYGKVAMVGDGINDAPALTRADIGIAIGAGTDVAIDSADVVLRNSKLSDVVKAIRLSRATLTNIHENLFWAFIYNLICIPLAMGLTSYKMNPMVGAAAMSLSSFTVCMNALRLNLIKLDKKNKKQTKHVDLPDDLFKQKEIETVIHIEGMMCEHCEKKVRKALETISNVDVVKVSHTEGIAVIQSNAKVSENDIKKIIEAEDYTVLSIDEGGKEKMEKTMKIEGMMCCHCAATVKKALESVDGVASAEVSNEKGEAVVTLNKEVSNETLKTAVEAKDYKVTDIH